MNAGIPVFASQGTLEALGIEKDLKTCVVQDKVPAPVPEMDFEILPFALHHDAAEPLGFIIRADHEYLLFAPETNCVAYQFKIPFSIIAIECNYDQSILETRVHTKDINETLAKRLLDTHQSKDAAIEYLQKFCDLSKCREIHLLHLSSDNLGDKEQVRKEIEQKFYIKTIICERGKS